MVPVVSIWGREDGLGSSCVTGRNLIKFDEFKNFNNDPKHSQTILVFDFIIFTDLIFLVAKPKYVPSILFTSYLTLSRCVRFCNYMPSATLSIFNVCASFSQFSLPISHSRIFFFFFISFFFFLFCCRNIVPYFTRHP